MSYGDISGDVEKHIHNLEFENQQFVKAIEKEKLHIYALESQINEFEVEIERLQQSTGQLDDDTKLYHRQFTQNRDGIENLKSTLRLSDHGDALTSRYNSIVAEGEKNRKERSIILEQYLHIWEDYSKKYASYPEAKTLLKAQQNLRNAKDEMGVLNQQKKELVNSLDELKGNYGDFTPFKSRNEFVLKLAELGLSYFKKRFVIKAAYDDCRKTERKLKEMEASLRLQEIEKLKQKEKMVAEKEQIVDDSSSITSTTEKSEISEQSTREVPQNENTEKCIDVSQLMSPPTHTAPRRKSPMKVATSNQQAPTQAYSHTVLKTPGRSIPMLCIPSRVVSTSAATSTPRTPATSTRGTTELPQLTPAHPTGAVVPPSPPLTGKLSVMYKPQSGSPETQTSMDVSTDVSNSLQSESVMDISSSFSGSNIRTSAVKSDFQESIQTDIETVPTAENLSPRKMATQEDEDVRAKTPHHERNASSMVQNQSITPSSNSLLGQTPKTPKTPTERSITGTPKTPGSGFDIGKELAKLKLLIADSPSSGFVYSKRPMYDSQVQQNTETSKNQWSGLPFFQTVSPTGGRHGAQGDSSRNTITTTTRSSPRVTEDGRGDEKSRKIGNTILGTSSGGILRENAGSASFKSGDCLSEEFSFNFGCGAKAASGDAESAFQFGGPSITMVESKDSTDFMKMFGGENDPDAVGSTPFSFDFRETENGSPNKTKSNFNLF